MGWVQLPLKHHTRSFILVCAISGSLVALPAQSAVVTLHNGDQITGDVLQLQSDTLSFKSIIFGEVNIPWSEVRQLISDDSLRVKLSDGTQISGQVKLDETGAITIHQEQSAEPRVFMRQDVAALNPPIADDAVQYSGRLDAGGTINRGNANGSQTNLIGEFIARTPQDRYTVGVELNEARAFGVTTTSNRQLLTQYDTFLSETDYLYVNAKAERDVLADLDLRASVGGGLGHQFIETDATKLSGQAGLSYVRENYGLAPDESFPSLSLGMKYEQKLFGDRLIYFHYLDSQTSLTDASDTILRNRLGLRLPISKGVAVSAQLNTDYDHQPALGNDKTDTALIFTVGVGF